MRTSTHTLALLATSCICMLWLYACIQDETPPADQRKKLFEYTNRCMAPIEEVLYKVEQETPFMDNFRRELGTPLWEHTYVISKDNRIFYLVPVYHAGSPHTINTIWFFYLEDQTVTYYPIQRSDKELYLYGQEFVFDLLSNNVFGNKSTSKTTFKLQPDPSTRGLVTSERCWDVYTGYRDKSGREVTAYSYTNCISSTFWVGGDDGRPPGWGDESYSYRGRERVYPLFFNNSRLLKIYSETPT